MGKSFSTRLTDESQEALHFLRNKNININRMINRIILRTAQEEGWLVSLIPGSKSPASVSKASKPTSKKTKDETQTTQETFRVLPQYEPAPENQNDEVAITSIVQFADPIQVTVIQNMDTAPKAENPVIARDETPALGQSVASSEYPTGTMEELRIRMHKLSKSLNQNSNSEMELKHL